MPGQNFSNHLRIVPLFHFIGYPLALAAIAGSIVKLYRNYSIGIGGLLTPVLLIIISFTLLLLLWFTRSFALKAQDRAIRAEENLRYFAITGSLLDSKLTMKQIIALRFAPNSELLDLAHKAVNENLKPSEIKKAIQHWKEDHNRV